MKLYFTTAFFCSFGSLLALAPSESTLSCQSGQVLEGLAMESKILGGPVAYAVYLPPDYACSSRRYPAVYLLHGYTDDESAWIQFGQVNRTADDAILSGKLAPMIIVMPDGGVTWYVNDFRGTTRFEDMFVTEMIPFIDATYRTRPDREYRGISGLSMGGFGSLQLSMRHTDLFSACAAFSSAVWRDEDLISMPDERYDAVLGPIFGEGLRGRDRLSYHLQSYSPMSLARETPVDQLKKVRWYLDCGDDDFLSAGNATLHVLMLERKVPHEYRVRDGAHTWSYWRTGILDGLLFIAEGFHR